MSDVAHQATLMPEPPVRLSTHTVVNIRDMVPMTWSVRAPSWWTVVTTIGCVLCWLLLYTCIDAGASADAAADRAS